MSTPLWVTGGVLALLVLFVIVQYNKLIQLRLRIRESWANVDTELKRRHDLVPNLVETVRAYARHERSVLETLTRLRSQFRGRKDESPERQALEQQMSDALVRVLGVAEAYPALRANEGFVKLQDELANTEDRIQASRRFFNANVRDYNNQVQQFPSNVVARSFKFAVHEYFELTLASERLRPAVRL